MYELTSLGTKTLQLHQRNTPTLERSNAMLATNKHNVWYSSLHNIVIKEQITLLATYTRYEMCKLIYKCVTPKRNLRVTQTVRKTSKLKPEMMAC